MQTLINNRIKYELIFPIGGIKIYCTKSKALFRLKYQYFIEKLKGHDKIDDFKNWFGYYDKVDIKKQPFVYFNFGASNPESEFIIELNENYFFYFKKRLVVGIFFINNDIHCIYTNHF